MSVEFIDTNILIYAHDRSAGKKHEQAAALLSRLFDDANGALSIQVLAEFCAVAAKKLAAKGLDAEGAVSDLGSWTIHRPAHSDILRSWNLRRRYKVSWWDAMVLNSAMETGCSILWSEDLNDGQRYGTVTVRNPFR